MNRIYFSDPIPEHGRCRLPTAKAHHIAHVLRLAAGDPVVLFDGRGSAWDGRVAAITRGEVEIQIERARDEDRESPLPVTLVQAVSSGERMDYTIQKAVELGVGRVQPVLAERCVVRLSGERAHKRVAHWQAVAGSACEQCGRNRVPEVGPLLGVAEWLSGLAASPGLRLLLAPGAALRIGELERPAAGVILLAGPEGGFTDAEAADAERAGFRSLRLGPRVLRTETAAVAALAVLQARWGDI